MGMSLVFFLTHCGIHTCLLVALYRCSKSLKLGNFQIAVL